MVQEQYGQLGGETDQQDVDSTMDGLDTAPEPVYTPPVTPAPTTPSKPYPTIAKIESAKVFQDLKPKDKRVVIDAWVRRSPFTKDLTPPELQKVLNTFQSRHPDDAFDTDVTLTADQVKKQFGIGDKDIKYLYGGDPNSKQTDCSGYMCALYKRNGVNLDPQKYRTAQSQWANAPGTQIKDRNAIQPGDQIFFTGTNGHTDGSASHTGFYLGPGPNGERLFTHNSSTKGGVTVSDLNRYPLQFIGAKRYDYIDKIVKGRQQPAPTPGAVPPAAPSPQAHGATQPGVVTPSTPAPAATESIGELRRLEGVQEQRDKSVIKSYAPQFQKPSIPFEHAIALTQLPQEKWDDYLQWASGEQIVKPGDRKPLIATDQPILSEAGRIAIPQKARELIAEMRSADVAPNSVGKKLGTKAAVELFERAQNRAANYQQDRAAREAGGLTRLMHEQNEADRAVFGLGSSSTPGHAVGAAIPNVTEALEGMGVPGKAANLVLSMATPSNALLGKALKPVEAAVAARVTGPVAEKLMGASAAARKGGAMLPKVATPASRALAATAKATEVAGHSVVPAAFAAPMAAEAVTAAKEGRWEDAAALALAAGAPFLVRPGLTAAGKVAERVLPKDVSKYQAWAEQISRNPKRQYTTKSDLIESARRMVATGADNPVAIAELSKSLNVSPAVAKSVLRHVRIAEGVPNAVPIRRSTQETARPREAGQNLSEGGTGVRQGVEGPETARTGEVQSQTVPTAQPQRVDPALQAQVDRLRAKITEKVPNASAQQVDDALNKIVRFRTSQAANSSGRYTAADLLGRVNVGEIQKAVKESAALREYLPLRGKRIEADPVKLAERELVGKKLPGFFPTPTHLAEHMVDLADIHKGMTVLEPSAGSGRIADAILSKSSTHPAVIEQSSMLADLLEKKGHQVERGDFLEHKGEYDRIVMNPPFENGQDITHVQHAYDLLKPGGRIVAIMGEGPFFRSDKQATGFREWLDENGGTSEKLPEGTFKESNTGTNTRLVVIDKPSGTLFQNAEHRENRVGRLPQSEAPSTTEKPKRFKIMDEDRRAVISETDSEALADAARSQRFHVVDNADTGIPSKSSQPEGPGQLFQKAEAPKGAIKFEEGFKSTIQFFKHADVTTIEHEFFHDAMDVQRHLAEEVQNPQAMKDWDTLSAFVGAKKDKNGKWAWGEKEHETAARAWERYSHDGIAPSEELKPVFARIAEWFREVYKRVAGSSIENEVSPEVREYFDRMLTGREARAEASVSDLAKSETQPNLSLTGETQSGRVKETAETSTGSEPNVKEPARTETSAPVNAKTETRVSGEATAQTGVPSTKPSPEGPTKKARPVEEATGLANQVQEREALAKIISEVESAGGKGKEHWQKVGKAAVENPDHPDADYQALAYRVEAGEAELTGERVGILLEGKRLLENEMLVKRNALDADKGNKEKIAEYQEARTRLDDYLKAVQSGKGRWSDVGRALQAGVELDTGNFAQVIAERNRTGSRASDAALKALTDKVAERDARIADLETKAATVAADRAVQRLSRERRTAQALEDIQKRRKGLIAQLKGEKTLHQEAEPPSTLFQRDEVDPTKARAIYELARTYVEEGVVKFSDVVDRIAEDIDWKREDVINALAAKMSKELPSLDLQKQMRDLKTLAAAEARLAEAEKGVFPGKKPKPVVSAQLKELRSRFSELKSLTEINAKIEDLKQQLLSGEFKKPDERESAVTARLENLRAERDFYSSKVRHAIREPEPRLTVAARVASGIMRGLRLGSDIGIMFRQGLVVAGELPLDVGNAIYHRLRGLEKTDVKAYRATVEALKNMTSDRAMIKYEHRAAEKRAADGVLYVVKEKKAGLQTTDRLYNVEENVLGVALSRLPVVGPLLDRFQHIWINEARRSMFRSAVDAGFNEAELHEYARYINTVLGRSNAKQIHAATELILTSPRYERSRWEFIGQIVQSPVTAVRATRNRAARAKVASLAATAATAYLVIKAAEQQGYEADWDYDSSEFLKMRRGDEVWDISAGLAPRIRDVIRLFLWAKNPTNKENLGRIVKDAASRPLSPFVKTPIEQASAEIQNQQGVPDDKINSAFTGYPMNPDEKGWWAWTPLIVNTFHNTLYGEGDTGAAISAGLKEFVGTSINRYPQKGNQPGSGGNGTGRKKERDRGALSGSVLR